MANLILVGESLRILLVSAREEAREEIGSLLLGRAGDHRLYWVAQPELALALAQDLLPHVVLVDDELGEASVGGLIGTFAARMPSAAVVALVRQGAMQAASQAVLAGARAFVARPIQPEELMSALRQVLAQRSVAGREPDALPVSDSHIIVFCAPKGGTGRTTLAINTWIALQAVGGEVALVDADYAAPALDVALNLQAERDISDLLPQLGRLDRDLLEGVLAHHASGVRVLLAPPPGSGAQISLPQVQQVLVWLKRIYPWVIVDLGLPLDEMAYAFLDAADCIVMNVLPEMVGLRNTRLMLDQLEARGYPGSKVWLVLNRATLPGGITLRDIEERLRVHVRHTVPDDQPLATHSVNRGVPLIMSHRNSAVARAVRGLAAMLANEYVPAAAPEGAGGRLGNMLAGLRRPRPAGSGT